jgi:DNA-binding MarR family transcriptional regulator
LTLRPADSLGYQVNHLARLFERALRDGIAPYGVVPGQFPALLALYEEDGITQAELTRTVSIEQPTMANTLQRMERDGLVERTVDPTDGRRARIRLTERAMRLEEPLTAVAREINAAAAEALDPNEHETLMRAIGKLITHLGRSPVSRGAPRRSTAAAH